MYHQNNQLLAYIKCFLGNPHRSTLWCGKNIYILTKIYKYHCLQQFKISVNTEYMFAGVECTSSKSMKKYESSDLFDFF